MSPAPGVQAPGIQAPAVQVPGVQAADGPRSQIAQGAPLLGSV